MPVEREKLLHKVRALLAKTLHNGCTEQEASIALAKAQAIINAYEISSEELDLTKQEKAILSSMGVHDPHDINRLLASAIARYTRTEAWRNKQDGVTYCGLKADAEFAAWLANSLANFVKIQLAGHLAKTPYRKDQRRAVINGFVMGCTKRISQRLIELSEKAANATGAPKGTALAVIQDAAIQEFMTEHEINPRPARRSTRNVDPQSYDEGYSAGDRAPFARPLEKSPAAPPR